MLDKPVDEIVYDANGKVCGVKSGNEVTKIYVTLNDSYTYKVLAFLIVLNLKYKGCQNKTSYW